MANSFQGPRLSICAETNGCRRTGACELIHACRSWLVDEGLSEFVDVHESSCLDACDRPVVCELKDLSGHKRLIVGQNAEDFARLKRKILKALGFDKKTRRSLAEPSL